MVRGQRIRALDGLRAVAVTMVLFFHIDDDILPGGFIGVDVFFCLSGYVIARQLFKEITTTRTVELGTFWRRRFLRLFPPPADPGVGGVRGRGRMVRIHSI